MYFGFEYNDVQAPHIFSAEDELEPQPFPNLDAACRWVNRIVRSDWWGDADVYVVGKNFDVFPRSAGHERDEDGVHWLYLPPKWSWDKNVILHELAHAKTPKAKQSHGPAYARNRIEAQYLFGKRGSGDRLRELFKEYGVRVGR